MKNNKEYIENLKNEILNWADRQDWEDAVNRCGATEAEQAGISYRIAGFASASGADVDLALQETKYYRNQQEIVNTEAPILQIEE